VDVGSTNTKVVAIAPDGEVLARASRPTPRRPHDLAIHSPALISAIEDMITEVCGARLVVNAVCTAGVGEDGVLLDDRLAPLTPALAWFDPRRQASFAVIRGGLGPEDDFDAETDPVRALAGWSWARAQVPDGTARCWVALTDAAAVAWTRRPFFSDTLASRTGAWRSADCEWSELRVAATLGETQLLPPVIATGEVVGELLSRRLSDAGVLTAGAVVVAGGHDHPIAGWGVDRMLPGAILDSMGTAEVVVTQSSEALSRRRGEVEVAAGIRSTGTTVLRVEELARNVQWASQDTAVAARIRALLEGSATPARVLDAGYFVPGRRGGGMPSYVLGAPADPHVRASAVLGALALAGRDALAAVADRAAPHAEVRLAGGWVRSPGWLEIKASVSGLAAAPILEPEVTAVGAALLAATAIGWEADAARALGGFSTAMLR
jgi:sugar (pentulose or hexulose) kinase